MLPKNCECKFKYLHPRDQIAQIMARIYRYDMTTTSGGNLSIKDDSGDIWVSPCGKDKGTLKPEDMVCVRSNGDILGKYTRIV